ncbi:hypothetical protein QBC38DRAFT_482377 [Podospora fimiseda]|uniref:C2 domain-containing protein n=1 Tax=Podospora fimiseda TaxID=252190 RepID=A0AAN7H1B8_9PEZI|nr:hypothetical protein QBC38DRAFT_482377 [Podospora fimiseda]
MDPVSITGLVGSCLSLGATITKTIRGLHDLKGRYDDAPMEVSLLLSQVAATQVTVQLMQKWLESAPQRQTIQSDEQIMTALEQCFDSCLLVITHIEKHITKVNFAEGRMSLGGRIKHIWDEEEVARYRNHLSCQSQALGMLFQNVQGSTSGSNHQFITKQENQRILKQAHDTASLYIDFSDEKISVFQQSLASGAPDFDTAFDFDDLTLDSGPYRAAFRSMLRKDREARRRDMQAPTEGQTEEASDEFPNPEPSSSKQQRIQPRFDQFASMQINDTKRAQQHVRLGPDPSDFASMQFSDANKVEDTPPTSVAESSTPVGRGPSSAQNDHISRQEGPLGVLRFYIRCANGLRISSNPRNLSPFLDTYARILSSSGIEKYRTKVCKRTNNPVWNEATYVLLEATTDKFFLEVATLRTWAQDESLGLTKFDSDASGYLVKGAGDRYLVCDRKHAQSKILNLRGKENGIIQFDVAFYPWNQDLGHDVSAPLPWIPTREHELYRESINPSSHKKGKQPRLERMRGMFGGSRDGRLGLRGYQPLELEDGSVVSDEVELYERLTSSLDEVTTSDIEQGTELLRKLYEYQLRIWAGDVHGVDPRLEPETVLDRQILPELRNLLSQWDTRTGAWTDEEIAELREIANMLTRWDYKHPRF